MAKYLVGVVVVILAAVLFLNRGESKAARVSKCMEKAGATVRRSGHFQQLFPYLVALGENARVRSFPELEHAKVYGVQYGDAEALLFVGKRDDDAQRFEETVVEFAGSGGASVRSQRSGNVVLLWTRSIEPSMSAPLDACVA